jgi:hypothetical protein
MGGYKKLIIDVNGDSNQTSAETINLQFNGDFLGHYNYANIYFGGATPASGVNQATGATSAQSCSAGYTGYAASGTINIVGYASTSFSKMFNTTCGSDSPSSTYGGTYGLNGSGAWQSTAAITSIKFTPAAGNFAVGFTISISGTN